MTHPCSSCWEVRILKILCAAYMGLESISCGRRYLSALKGEAKKRLQGSGWMYGASSPSTASRAIISRRFITEHRRRPRKRSRCPRCLFGTRVLSCVVHHTDFLLSPVQSWRYLTVLSTSLTIPTIPSLVDASSILYNEEEAVKIS